MGTKWTKEQQQVIDTRDSNILVSAAAGSGKTAVLVERILALVTDESHPVDIDRLLVVTFTNAAAAEMRERIRGALEKRAEAEPENLHLQRQLVLIHNAEITTIHSFCLHVLRNHFHTIGLDPSFRVADEGEVLLLRQEVLSKTMDEAYEEGDAEFHAFLEQFSNGKNDLEVERMVLSLYHFSQGQPWPEEWLKNCRRMYEPEHLEEGAWLAFAWGDSMQMLEDVREQLEQAMELAKAPDGPYPYCKALQDDIIIVETLQKAGNYRELSGAFAKMPAYTRLSTKKDPSISEEKKERVKQIREEVKTNLASLQDWYFYDREEMLLREFQESGVICRVLTRLVERFMKKLAERKAEKNILDFSDLEHLALRVLVEKKEGEILPTAAALEYGEKFREIMIDEYQDSNLVQEILLNSVSGRGKGEKNLFMVGDVKQSIYRFRLARPELFMDKYKRYQNLEGAVRIDLHRNFRSRSQVLSSVNYIFRQIMTENLGGIRYDKDAALYVGAKFPDVETDLPGEFCTEILLQEASTGKREEEARMVGQRIRRLVRETFVFDKETGERRRAEYRDIVVLLRTVSGWADTVGEVLADMGIPCSAGSRTGYFSTVEVRTVLAYLQILDNPIQDIPFASVLRSPIGGMTDEELAKIRSASEARYFYDCCREYLEHGPEDKIREKLQKFFETLEEFRRRAADTPVHLLLWEILEETGYGEYAASMPAGEQRKANLDMLVEKAIAYEATSYRGLYHFVRYIESLKKYEVDYGEASLGGEAENVVRIMSIHKSKGLEFPIVFVSGLGKQFNETDIRSKVVMHPELGIGCDYVDVEERLRRPTLLKKIIQRVTTSENLGEELRVLYVAMTRAKEKLILTGSVADAENKLKKWRTGSLGGGEQLAYSRLTMASTYLDWLMAALLRHDDVQRELQDAGWLEEVTARDAFWDGFGEEWNRIRSEQEAGIQEDEILAADMDKKAEQEFRDACRTSFQIQIQTSGETVLEEAGNLSRETARMQELLDMDPSVCRDEAAREYLERVFTQAYPFRQAQDIPGKLSVSELKRLSHVPEEEEAEELYRQETVIPLIPGFRSGETAIQGAARGTIYHAFMENLDFSKKDDLERQLEELISCGKMTQEEAGVIRLGEIRRFLESGTGMRMEQAAGAGTLHREQPFVLGVAADEIRSHWSGEETVLVQGIIDVWFQEGDGEIVVLDYKTDRVPHMEVLAEKYGAQLDYYALALERLTGRRVKEKIIYSFYLGEALSLYQKSICRIWEQDKK